MTFQTLKQKIGRACLGFLLLCGTAQATNNDPVILVHGFAGFGPGEMFGYNYWGGFTDIAGQLQTRYPDQVVKAATVGPFSSNWDRAVELFYQIKGGCVDYGAAHSAQYGHLQVPEDFYHNGHTCYPGLYPDWDANHPVHLVSHSMGGQTSRMLVQLLAANGAPGNPGLFVYPVSAAWVKSVTTIATPNDGTTLAYSITDWVPPAQQLVGGLVTLAGLSGTSTAKIYDFKFDQWKIAPQQPGESFNSYMKRVMASPLWHNTNDLSPYDLSPAGAMAENDWVKDQANVYYFSVTTNASYSGFLTGWSYPRLDANPLIGLFAGPGFMGNFTPDGRPFPPVSPQSWWPSDAVVNTIAQKAPTWAMSPDGTIYARAVTITDVSNGAAPIAGTWNFKGEMATFDHFDIIGWTPFWDSVSWYKTQVDQLRGL
jgi:triacylglycerol lipase